MKAILILFAIFSLSKIFAQTDSVLPKREQQLLVYLNELRESEKDLDRNEKNKKFKNYLFETIQLPGAFDYPFSLLKSVGSLKSDDNLLRLFNWNVEQDDHTQKYYCYILRKDKEEIKISELIDNSFALAPRPQEILEGKNWYGALYYKIIPITKNGKHLYTLLGYDANTVSSNIKLIDVLSFTGNNPKLGAPIFKVGKETFNRMFYEHSEKAYMSLKYEEEYNRIIFDHLSPESPSMEGFYCYYVPDFSYDAFTFVKDKWILQEEVVGVNKKTDEKIVVRVQNPKTGKIEEVEYKGKWVDPSDEGAVAGANTHKATTPEEQIEEDENKNVKKGTTKTDTLKEKKAKKKNRLYSSYIFTDIKKKPRKRR
ncbi:MAG: hypothetical protein HYR91_14805 [Flavobacteriia bacterium]|nr:hypothetical protein [Flavobacteriia bacterium]